MIPSTGPFRAFLAGLCLCFMATTSAMAAKVSCRDWNMAKHLKTAKFFQRARAADVSRCLDAGANVDARGNYGLTPLHLAAGYNENLAVLTALLKAGAGVNARDKFDRNPLHWAASNRNPEIAAALLKAGGEVNAQTDGGQTPLHQAAYNETRRSWRPSYRPEATRTREKCSDAPPCSMLRSTKTRDRGYTAEGRGQRERAG